MFAKIFSSIYDSSIADDWQTRVVFQDMLILADKDGIVDMTPAAIARRTNIPIEIVQQAIPKLEDVDTASRTPDHDGRRIVRMDAHRNWGWRIVNFVKYRESATKEMLRMAEADRKRAYRARHGHPSPTPPTLNKAEAEAEGDKSSDMSRTSGNRRTGLAAAPQTLTTAERITLEDSLKRCDKRLSELKEADLPKAVEERRMLKDERKRILDRLGLKI